MAPDEPMSSMPSAYRSGGMQNESAPADNTPKFEGGANITTILMIAAIILSLAAIYFSLGTPRGFSAEDRATLMAVAADLRQIQQKEIVLSSPLKTTVSVQKTFPASDIFPSDFTLKVDQNVPIDTTLTAVSSTGQLVNLRINDNMRVRADIPVDTSKSMGSAQIVLNKEIPIDTTFSATLKVSAVYGQELNDMINRLEAMAQKK